MRRVVVTGTGVVSALGIGYDAHVAGLRSGRAGIGPIELIETEGLSIGIAAEARGYVGAEHFSRNELALRDRVTQMALTAAGEAVSRAGITFDEALALRTATVIGTSMGGQHTQDDNYRLIYRDNKPRVHPFTVPKLMANAPSSWISMEHGLKGPAWTVSTACASSNHAIGQAFHMIRCGMADAAVTGGAESGLTYGVLKAWEGLRVMSKDTCRPFSKTRSGMVQGEGAAILVLEDMETAQARGATILGEVVGFGMTADANDIVQPSWGAVAGLLDQVDAWPLHRGSRGAGNGGDPVGARFRHRAADHQFRGSGPRMRSGRGAQYRARGGCALRAVEFFRIRWSQCRSGRA